MRPLRLSNLTTFSRPNFVITMVRPRPDAPANIAEFIVPLNLNKLDIRDYLYNVYDVRALGVRSYVQQQKVKLRPQSQTRAMYRPRAIKKMFVELEKPFVWPEEPKTFEDWDKKTFDAAQEDQKAMMDTINPESKKKPSKDRLSMREQAKLLLDGEEEWKSTRWSPRWEDVGEAVEVDAGVELPKEK